MSAVHGHISIPHFRTPIGITGMLKAFFKRGGKKGLPHLVKRVFVTHKKQPTEIDPQRITKIK